MGVQSLNRWVVCLRQGRRRRWVRPELLERFVSQGDPAAFEVILQRHGPMVLRVCRRVLDDPNDVDDAFQATFLILVKKSRVDPRARGAGDVALWRGPPRGGACPGKRPAQAVARAIGRGSDRHGKTPRASMRRPSSCERFLDDELERLPYRFRAPLILCDLEGQTHEQAAAQLRCPVGTVKSRLSRGRERLARSPGPPGSRARGGLTSFLAAEAAWRYPASC